MTTKVPTVEINDRDLSVNPRMLRREGRIPATIYGHNIPSVSVTVDKKSFSYIYNHQNPNLMVLSNAGKQNRVLIKNVQKDPRTTEILNVEFLQVNENEMVTLSIPLTLVNDSPAVKLGGVLLQMIDEIEVECLPKNIPDQIKFDLSTISEMDTTITIADLALGNDVKSVLSSDTAVLKVASPKEETEAAAVADEAAAAAE